MRRSALVVLVLLLAQPAAASAVDRKQVRADADWILSAQLPDGAIAANPDRVLILPYVSGFAATGLASATRITGDRRYAEASWRWLRWYQEHMDERGFVTDYTVTNGVLESTGTMDSTDSYAAMFLVATHRTFAVDPRRKQLEALRPGIDKALAAIRATTDRDGLTWARPDFRVKYLMDQCEVYAGLLAAAELATPLGDDELARRAGKRALRLRAAVDRLWSRKRAGFVWAVHGDGARDPASYDRLFPEAMQQAWAVAFGLADGRRAERILARLTAVQPRWDRTNESYWVPAAWAFARVGDAQRARLAARRIRSTADLRDRAWPFSVAEAGQLLMLDDTAGRSFRLLG